MLVTVTYPPWWWYTSDCSCFYCRVEQVLRLFHRTHSSRLSPLSLHFHFYTYSTFLPLCLFPALLLLRPLLLPRHSLSSINFFVTHFIMSLVPFNRSKQLQKCAKSVATRLLRKSYVRSKIRPAAYLWEPIESFEWFFRGAACYLLPYKILNECFILQYFYRALLS